MKRCILKSKIHRIKVTETELYYEGSITLDEDLLEKANILPYEKVEVLNLNTGSRIETYAIPGRRGSGVVCLNGPAARTAQVGDEIIVLSYWWVDEEEISGGKLPKPIIIRG